MKFQIQNPKSKIQTRKNHYNNARKAYIVGVLKLGFGILFSISFLVLGISCNSRAAPKVSYNWNLLHDGVVYAKYSFPVGEQERTTIHAFQIDPKKIKLDVVLTNKSHPQGMTAKEFAKTNKAALVINGGFFTEEHKSIGLLIQNGKKINPIHRTSWWSIFGLKNGKPFIVRPKGFRALPEISMAVQVGPRLVINDSIPKLKPSLAARSAVGITRNNKVVLVITEGSPISMLEIARRMKNSRFKGGLECVNAMALDGGSSAQLYAKIGKFERSVPGPSTVPNGIAVYLKSTH